MSVPVSVGGGFLPYGRKACRATSARRLGFPASCRHSGNVFTAWRACGLQKGLVGSNPTPSVGGGALIKSRRRLTFGAQYAA